MAIEETNLLPIGSIVRFKEWEQALMIYGRIQSDSKNKKVWDYVACFYPYGNIAPDSNIFFNHKDISEILFKGYETKEEIALRNELIKAKKIVKQSLEDVEKK